MKIQLLLKRYYRLMPKTFLRFAIIGSLGFLVNFFCLAITYDYLGLSIIVSQIISAVVAFSITFVGNSFWAFTGHSHHKISKKFIKYNLTSTIGLFVNSTIVVILVSKLNLFYGLALVVGSATALAWNYTANIHVVFSKSKMGFRERVRNKAQALIQGK